MATDFEEKRQKAIRKDDRDFGEDEFSKAFENFYKGNPKARINRHGFDQINDPDKHDIMICYVQSSDGNWIVSLYTEKEHIDVEKICAKYGGGGHKGAAGFRPETLPF